MKASSANNYAWHLPYADGLSTRYHGHRDTDDGAQMGAYLCETLKKWCPVNCSSNRNVICSPVVDENEPEQCVGLHREWQ